MPPLPAAHAAIITEVGATDIVHPDPDHDGCDFEDYLASDWSTVDANLAGPWRFYWMGGYWNGTKEEASL
jgi:hypothetical protein